MLSAVVTRERHRDRGTRRARASLAELGRELREARRGAGLRQADVARIAGVSASWVSQIERGSRGGRQLPTARASLLAVVGLDLSVRAYPGRFSHSGTTAIDVCWAASVSLLPQGAPWRTEVPLPDPGDQRAWDAMTELCGTCGWASRRSCGRRTSRPWSGRIDLKKRDGVVDRVVLVLADTRHNRGLDPPPRGCAASLVSHPEADCRSHGAAITLGPRR